MSNEKTSFVYVTYLTFRRSGSQYGANFQGLCRRSKRLGRNAQQSE